jgi:flavin reductase (DIM6/NTAB) family NADH-FMN oxidoreductase RutF
VPTATGEKHRLRTVMGELVTGVCAASTVVHGHPGLRDDAIVVNSFTSVSLEPPLVSINLRRDSSFLTRVRRAGVWAVSLLNEGMEPLARALSVPHEQRPALDRVARWVPGPTTGCPVLADSPGTVECELHRCVGIGDHVVVVGLVVGLAREPIPPLVFHRGAYLAAAVGHQHPRR